MKVVKTLLFLTGFMALVVHAQSDLLKESDIDSWIGEQEGKSDKNLLDLSSDESPALSPREEAVESSPPVSDQLEQEMYRNENLEDSAPQEQISEISEGIRRDFYEDPTSKPPAVKKTPTAVGKRAQVFDFGAEEEALLQKAQLMGDALPQQVWRELIHETRYEKYVVQKGDWLWKISKNLFGSGFYYPTIWANNPQVTNPHLIEPGMVLLFTTGSEDSLPDFTMGEYKGKKDLSVLNSQELAQLFRQMQQYGEEVAPPWLAEREHLKKQGVNFRLEGGLDYDDLRKLGAHNNLVDEYKKYWPPKKTLPVHLDQDMVQENVVFDDSSQIKYRLNNGYDVRALASSAKLNILGTIDSAIRSGQLIRTVERIYVKFERGDILPGDRFSVFSEEGVVSHPQSTREGYRFLLNGHITVLQKIQDNLWECEVTKAFGKITRGHHVTQYRPKVNVDDLYSAREIAARVVGGEHASKTQFSLGDLIFIDRGESDGVVPGNIFNVYANRDRSDKKEIAATETTYKVGELKVLMTSPSFSTAMITKSFLPWELGFLAITKSKEDAVLAQRLGRTSKTIRSTSGDGLDISLNELDAERLGPTKKDGQLSYRLSEEELRALDAAQRDRDTWNTSEGALQEIGRQLGEVEQLLENQKPQESSSNLLDALESNEGGIDLDTLESQNPTTSSPPKPTYSPFNLGKVDTKNFYGLDPEDVAIMQGMLEESSGKQKAVRDAESL